MGYIKGDDWGPPVATMIKTVWLVEFGKEHWVQLGKTWCGRDMHNVVRFGELPIREADFSFIRRGVEDCPEGFCLPCWDGLWMAVLSGGQKGKRDQIASSYGPASD